MSQKIRNNSSVNLMMEYENLVDPGNEHRHDADKESGVDDKRSAKQDGDTVIINTSDSLIYFVSPRSVFTSLQHVKPPVSADFSICNFGFFCRKELVIEKATRIPLRLRLGSLQQCNYYEGKRQ